MFSTAFLGPPFQSSGLALSGGVVGTEERAELTLWDIGKLAVTKLKPRDGLGFAGLSSQERAELMPLWLLTLLMQFASVDERGL